MRDERYEVAPIGRVESPLVDRASAPKQGDEGAPDAWLIIDERFREGLFGLEAGAEVIVLTWLDRAERDVLLVHPRGDLANLCKGCSTLAPRTGQTRSACTGCGFSPSRATKST